MPSKKTPIKAKEKAKPRKRIQRPDEEQLMLLEKAIFHSYKLTFKADASGASNVLYDGEPVIGSTSDQIDLNSFFKLIVQTYSTL